jgi:putative SOS response-associated peptidase YedK
VIVSRYSLVFDTHATAVHGRIEFAMAGIPPFMQRPRYNIGRDQDILVFRAADNGTGLIAHTMRWGFTPHWIHGPNPVLQPVTVPASRILQPYFRDAFRQRRCLIPATGFYAWQGWENGPAAPYHVCMHDRQLFFIAGIWENCEGVDRVAMITTEANSLIQPIHDRMPAIIGPDAMNTWLHGERPQQTLLPYAAAAMDIYQVSRKVFAAGCDSAELIEPIDTPSPIRARA